MSIDSTLQVVFLLDITGSMGSQIEGVKSMVSTFCAVERQNVAVTVGTFTECSQGCFVSLSPAGLTARDLVHYVNNINLCRPPASPRVNAGGDDGPENVVASVFSLTERFTSNQNLLCFVVTDAEPHHINSPSPTATLEIKWLQEHGVEDTDIFKVLDAVVDSLNVTFVPILYSNAASDAWYQQAAVMTQGVILCPISSDSNLLARGLEAILGTMQNIATAQVVDDTMLNTVAQTCNGFRVALIDEDEFQIVESDRDATRRAMPAMSEDVRTALAGLVSTTRDKFSGKKASKRCRTVDGSVITWSTKLLVLMMLQEVRGSDDVQCASRATEIERLVTNMIEKFGDDAPDTKLLLKLVAEHNEQLTKARLVEPEEPFIFPGSVESSPIQCMIALESATEYLDSLVVEPFSEADVKDWMEMALRLAMVRFVDVVFPLDVFGKPDFADAWSANIRSVELGSVMTASAAVELRDMDTGCYRDPVSGVDNSAAVILAHPNDEILSRAYRIMSGLPSYQLLIQGYLLSGGLRAFPAVASGLQASCLLRLTRGLAVGQKYSDAQWEMVRSLVWSLRQSLATPAVGVVQAIQASEGLNPVDNIAKLMAGIITFLHRNPSTSLQEKTQVLRQLFEEWSADAIARTWKWQDSNNNVSAERFPTHDDVAECFAPPGEKETFNPVTAWHSIERFMDGEIPVRADWKGELSQRLQTTTLFKQVAHWFNTFVTTIHCPVHLKEFEEATQMVDEPEFLSTGDLADVFLESFLLGKRTGRYTLDPTSNEWHRGHATSAELDTLDINAIAKRIVGQAYRTNIAAWRTERAEYAHEKLIGEAVIISGETEEACTKILAELTVDVLGQKYKLNRMHALQVLRKLAPEQLSTLGLAVLIGGWTSEPPSQLRRQMDVIESLLAGCSPEVCQQVQEKLAARAVCSRETPNRTGHTCHNFYPGMTGWTQEYDDVRRPIASHKPKLIASLDAMREYTTFVAEKTAELANMPRLGPERRRLAHTLLHSADNPATVAQIKELVEFVITKDKLEDSHVQDQWERALARFARPTIKNRLQRLRSDLVKCLCA